MDSTLFANKLRKLPFFEKLLKISSSRPEKIYPVGGCIRDFVLGRTLMDIDIAVDADPLPLAKSFADASRGSLVLLDDINRIFRVVFKNKETIDFTLLRGTVEEDLKLRDFTINAVAFDPYQEIFIDPLGGFDDIEKKIIKCVSGESFTDDPLRMLRAVRFAAQLGFTIEINTEELIIREKEELLKAAAERIRDEWFKILKAEDSARFISMADDIGIVEILFPVAREMKGIEQNPYHKYDVWTHSLKTLEEVENLFKTDFEEFGKEKKKLKSYFEEEITSGRDRYLICKMGCLFHDISKPACRGYKDGRVTFIGHEKCGAKEISKVSESFRLSKRESSILQGMILNHLRPVFLGRMAEATPHALYRFFRDTCDCSVDTLILSWADVEAGMGPALTAGMIKKHHDLVKDLANKYFQQSTVVKPPRWINGDDLINIFGLKEGPEVGGILEKIDEASATGQIKSRDAALAFAQELLTTFD